MKVPCTMYYRSERIEIIHLQKCSASYPEHNHVSTYTIGIILSGKIALEHKGNVHELSQKQSFVIAPYELHAIKALTVYEMLSICLHVDFINTCQPSEIKKMVAQAIRSLPDPKWFKREIACLINQAVNDLYRKKNEAPILNTAFALKINQCIQKTPEKELKPEHLAREMGLSQYHLIRKFKKTIGLTPHQFQIQNKIRKAQRLLEQKTPLLNLPEVALDCGFYDQSHFSRHFKNRLKLTPRAYRQACKRLNF